MMAKIPAGNPQKKDTAVEILDATSDGLLSVDESCKVTYANKVMCMLFGLDVNDLIGKNISDLIPRHIDWTFHRYLEKALSEGIFIEMDNFKFAGKRFEVYFYPMRKGIAIFLHDITLKWHIDEMYRLALFLLDRINESVFLVRSDGRLFHVNDEACRLLGYTRDEIIHMKIFDIDSRITVDGWENEFNSIKERGRMIFESTLRAKDGTNIQVEVCANYIQLYGYGYYCVAARDITERLKEQKTLEKYLLFSENAHDIILFVRRDGRILEANEAAVNAYGYTYEDLLSLSIYDLRAFDPENIVDEQMETSFEKGILFETMHRRKDGSVLPVEVSSQGKMIGGQKVLLSVIRDITERKKAEDELRKSEANLIKAQHITHIGSYDLDIKNDKATCSDEFYHILGISPMEYFSYRSYLTLVHPDDRKTFDSVIQEAIDQGKTFNDESRIVRPDGVVLVVRADGEMVLDKSGKSIRMFGAIRDITEQKQSELELHNAKALVEMYNDLLGHDINNMNQVGIGYLEMAINTLGLSDEGKKLLSKPLEALVNSSKLIENVRKLQHIKLGETRYMVIDINDVILDVKNSYSNVKDRSIVINYSPAAGCKVEANDLLRDVFSNLVGNAIKHSTGVLEISMGVSCVSEDGIEYCRAYVEDNGPGISDSIKKLLFTRFQRGDTKAIGKGLGLYLVKTLVDEYGGKVWVEDRLPGDHSKGCRFVIMLPAIGT
jgi:PAS domain S-box-containing protein